MRHLIGIIRGEGIGPEIMDAGLRCLKEASGHRWQELYFRVYDGPLSGRGALSGLRAFYNDIRNEGGVIVRSSIPAPLCYRLREECELFYKEVAFEASAMKRGVLQPELLTSVDLLLLRENTMGPYHARYSRDRSGSHICGEEVYSVQGVQRVVEVAFRRAAERRSRLLILVKDEVLGPLGAAWRDATLAASQKFPKVSHEIAPPDSGSARLFLSPNEFDVVLTPDCEGDLLADQLAVLLCGTRALTPSVNCSSGDFASYQTIHGTAKALEGKDLANPAGIICAFALMLKRTMGWENESQILREAVYEVVNAALDNVTALRNGDLILSNFGSTSFTDAVVTRIREKMRSVDAA